jgi:hypothetical protein
MAKSAMTKKSLICALVIFEVILVVALIVMMAQ